MLDDQTDNFHAPLHMLLVSQSSQSLLIFFSSPYSVYQLFTYFKLEIPLCSRLVKALTSRCTVSPTFL